MTVVAFYALHAVDGRAPLRKSVAFEPPAWISRAEHRGRATYWLCKSAAVDIELLDPLDDVTTIRTTRPYRVQQIA